MFGSGIVIGVKEDWQSPGRFRVLVDGKPLETTFGEADEKWHWQSGGSFEVVDSGKITISLHDLSGFDGRCDAIYLTKETTPNLPGDDLKELSDWKDLLSGRAKEKVEELSFDLVVVGGGMSGCGVPH